MDPLDRADALLSRAQSRGAFVVTPESAISPMDAANTVQIPRNVVRGADAALIDPDSTAVVSRETIQRSDDSHHLADPDQTTELPAVGAGQSAQQAAEASEAVNAVEAAATVETEEVDGLIPTTTQRMRSKLARRLEG
ncbi:MAG: hypothetical protein GEU86_02830 [Actinophytocola sp.]|nr:hypothetical protein [Actinophytocola sp.]